MKPISMYIRHPGERMRLSISPLSGKRDSLPVPYWMYHKEYRRSYLCIITTGNILFDEMCERVQ